MNNPTKLLLCLYLGLPFSCQSPPKKSAKLPYVDPMIGTGFHGHTFPGPVKAHGRIQAGPDTHLLGWDASSGYHYDDSSLYGFSQTHLSGTGIGDMGDILLLPFQGNIPKEKPVAKLDHSGEIAKPGYYSLQIQAWDIQAEITASERTAWYRFTYPKNQSAKLSVDLAHILQANWGHSLIESKIEQIDTFSLRGYRMTSGWAKEDPIWFEMKCNQPIQSISYILDGEDTDERKIIQAKSIQAYLDFGELTEALEVQIAVSSVDEEGARLNLTEADQFASFEECRKALEESWEAELDDIEIESANPDILKNFYTALYHSKIAPMSYQDLDGRFRGIDRKIHQGKSYTVYSLWDVFRSWYPLMTIIRPERARTWAYDLYDHSKKGALLPKWALNGNYTGTMVGYPALAILADAFSKSMLDSIPDSLLMAGKKASSWQEDFYLKHKGSRAEKVMPKQIYYKEKYGFIPADSSLGSVSYGLEMAYYDWCLSQIAEGLGQEELAQSYEKKGQAFRTYFDKNSGFMRGINMDGSRSEEFDPRYSDHEKSDYIEGNAWQWTPLVLHDPESFKDLLGGREALGIWLDSLFSTSSEITGENRSADISGLIGQYAHGNEPSHHVPFLYQYSDRPWRTQEVLDQILFEFYQTNPEGIIGNEDCGQMSAWYVLNALGIYQMCPGKPFFQIGRPIVDHAKIRVEGGYFEIKVYNNARANKYLDDVRLNGQFLKGLNLAYTDIKAGNILEIYMSNTKP
ncbi:MAG: GH92 family glycosyl hydrolase [Bacteroidota bacterium]